jgi:hypothetical protein
MFMIIVKEVNPIIDYILMDLFILTSIKICLFHDDNVHPALRIIPNHIITSDYKQEMKILTSYILTSLDILINTFYNNLTQISFK